MNRYEKKYKIISGITTTVLMILMSLVLLFSYIGMPEVGDIDNGILVDFGDSRDGFSAAKPIAKAQPVEKKNESPVEEPDPEPEEVKEPIKEEELTQDYEDAPVVEEKKEDKEVKKKVEPKKEVKPEKPKKPIINANALFKGSSKVNEGTTKPGGDQGVKTGEKSVVKTGNGTGKGISFDLKGRIPKDISKPNYEIQEEGIVVVLIVVNPDGSVARATAGVRGSTTLNPKLLKIAESAARSTLFSKRQNSNLPQKGTISYEFVLE